MRDVNKSNHEPPVGDSIVAENARWTFGRGVPEHFDEHVARSVPYYRDSHELIASLSDFFLRNGGLVYDLGCSTGSLSKTIALRAADRGVRVVGIDREPEMVEAARHNCRELPQIDIQEGSIVEFSFEPADMIVSFYTIMFVQRDIASRCSTGSTRRSTGAAASSCSRRSVHQMHASRT